MQDDLPLTSGDRKSPFPKKILSDDEGGWQPKPPPTQFSGTHGPESANQDDAHFLPDEEVYEDTSAHRQRIIPEGEDVETAPASMPTLINSPYPARPVKNANQRRSQHLLKFMALVYGSIVLLVSAFALWFYSFVSRQMDERLVSSGSFAGNTLHTAKNPQTPAPGATSQDLQSISGSFQKQISDLQAQLTAAQTRLAEVEQQSKANSTRMKDVLESPSQTVRSAVPVESPLAESSPALGSDKDRPVSQPDLLLIKERNRLTAYADEAIATGAREPYDRLWAALDDSRLANLVHAARAEILRVQNYYLSGSRLDRFDIPVRDYYPDNATLRDSQLPDDKLITLLAKSSNPWQVRLKAANLLGMRRSTSVGDALVKAIKEDKNLDVVKEATFSFEQMTGYRARIFEPVSLEAWWKQYNDSPPPASRPPVKKPEQHEAASEKKSSKEKGSPASEVGKSKGD